MNTYWNVCSVLGPVVGDPRAMRVRVTSALRRPNRGMDAHYENRGMGKRLFTGNLPRGEAICSTSWKNELMLARRQGREMTFEVEETALSEVSWEKT